MEMVYNSQLFRSTEEYEASKHQKMKDPIRVHLKFSYFRGL